VADWSFPTWVTKPGSRLSRPLCFLWKTRPALPGRSSCPA